MSKKKNETRLFLVSHQSKRRVLSASEIPNDLFAAIRDAKPSKAAEKFNAELSGD